MTSLYLCTELDNLRSTVKLQALNLIDCNLIIDGQAKAIEKMQREIDRLKDGGKRIINHAELLYCLLNATRSEREYYKKEYEFLRKVLGIHGGGGKITKMRGQEILDLFRYADDSEFRLYGRVLPDGQRSIDRFGLEKFLRWGVDELLRIGDDIINVGAVVARACNAALAIAGERGQILDRYTKNLGKKIWVLVGKSGTRKPRIVKPKKKGIERLRELDSEKNEAAWVKGYKKNNGLDQESEGPTWEDMIKKYAGKSTRWPD